MMLGEIENCFVLLCRLVFVVVVACCLLLVFAVVVACCLLLVFAVVVACCLLLVFAVVVACCLFLQWLLLVACWWLLVGRCCFCCCGRGCDCSHPSLGLSLRIECEPCPAGTECPLDGTVVPTVCRPGSYREATAAGADPTKNVMCIWATVLVLIRLILGGSSQIVSRW